MSINIPVGKFTNDDAMPKMNAETSIFLNGGISFSSGEDAAARKRKELRDKLLKAETITLSKGGSAVDEKGKETGIKLTGGDKLASGEDAAARKRKELRDKLLKAETITLSKGGSAVDEKGKETGIKLTGGDKLAAQWYEENPTLLTMEKIAMERNFPQFTLDKLDDGRLCWVGILEPGVYESKFGEKRQYHVMAVYDNNHPNQKMGSSVKVYPLMPDVDELIESAGFRPYHLLVDSVGNLYLCTNKAENQKVGVTTTTAASVLGWASKWLMAFELVLTGDLSLSKFNEHDGI